MNSSNILYSVSFTLGILRHPTIDQSLRNNVTRMISFLSSITGPGTPSPSQASNITL